MSQTNNNNNNNNNNKKDLFPNLFEKLDKFIKTNTSTATTSTPTTTTTTSTTATATTNTPSTYTTTTTTFSFHKSLNSSFTDDNDDCTVNIQQTTVSNNDLQTSPLQQQQQQATSIITNEQQTHLNNEQQQQQQQQHQQQQPPKTTFNLISSLISEINNSDSTANSIVDSTVNSVKQKLLTKKRSLETSFENIIKSRTNSQTTISSPPKQSATMSDLSELTSNSTTANNTENNNDSTTPKLASSVSDYTLLNEEQPTETETSLPPPPPRPPSPQTVVAITPSTSPNKTEYSISLSNIKESLKDEDADDEDDKPPLPPPRKITPTTKMSPSTSQTLATQSSVSPAPPPPLPQTPVPSLFNNHTPPPARSTRSTFKSSPTKKLKQHSQSQTSLKHLNQPQSLPIVTQPPIKEKEPLDINKLFPESEPIEVQRPSIFSKIYNFLKKYKYYIIALSILIYYYVSKPAFVSGFVIGVLITSAIGYIILKLRIYKYINVFIISNLLNTDDKDDDNAIKNSQFRHKLFVTEKTDKNFNGVYRGWMNELREIYTPQTYFLNKTRSVYVSLDGNMLRLQTTNVPIPKRTTRNETTILPKFFEQRIYDITDCEISILPPDLCRKRYWSKKYPICLKKVKLLNKPQLLSSHLFGTQKSNTSDSSSQNGEITESSLKTTPPELLLPEDQLVLFGRCDREKEEWFNLFRKASKNQLINSSTFLTNKLKKRMSVVSLTPQTAIPSTTTTTTTTPTNSTTSTTTPKLDNVALSYDVKSESLSIKSTNEPFIKPMQVVDSNNPPIDKTIIFINAFLVRVFADFFTNKLYMDKIKTKIQNKLNKIRIPYFIEDLIITDVDLGSTVPVLNQCSDVWHDDKGLWIHVDLNYSGSVKLSLTTKLNLMSLKKFKIIDQNNLNDVTENRTRETSRIRYMGISNSDEEDSPESSGDEYVHYGSTDDDKFVEAQNKGKKIINIVNKIAASTYFQKATENKYIKMAMENVSNTQLLLTVEIKKVNGILALNIPNHPSDRLWYGFVGNPTLQLSATPQVGEKEYSYNAVSDWIADKVRQEFQKVLVFPNMDDFYIPILHSEVKLP